MAQEANAGGPLGQGRRTSGGGHILGIARFGLREWPDSVCRWRRTGRAMNDRATTTRAAILQMNALSPLLEQELASRFDVHRWFEIADHERFLSEHASSIRAVVTGGHIGLPNHLLERL